MRLFGIYNLARTLFSQFVQAVGSGAIESLVARPDGIECFLPISGLLGAASWIKGGEINTIHPAAVIIFVTAIVSSFLLRRSFCSWICPVATVSELAWKGGFRLFRRNWRLPAWLDVVLRCLKYLLMVFFIYSIAVVMSPEALSGFIRSDYHKIADVRLMNFFLHISPLALGIILGLVALSVVLRNPFCRYLCPYGALLGLVASLSPLRVTRNRERCVSCGACSQVCPTYIDVMHKSSVVSPECIGCWRCISHCRFNESTFNACRQALCHAGSPLCHSGRTDVLGRHNDWKADGTGQIHSLENLSAVTSTTVSAVCPSCS